MQVDLQLWALSGALEGKSSRGELHALNVSLSPLRRDVSQLQATAQGQAAALAASASAAQLQLLSTQWQLSLGTLNSTLDLLNSSLGSSLELKAERSQLLAVARNVSHNQVPPLAAVTPTCFIFLLLQESWPPVRLLVA